MNYQLTLTGWVLFFVVGAAHDVDLRTGSDHESAIRDCVASHSPVIALEWSLAALRSQVSALVGALHATEAA